MNRNVLTRPGRFVVRFLLRLGQIHKLQNCHGNQFLFMLTIVVHWRTPRRGLFTRQGAFRQKPPVTVILILRLRVGTISFLFLDGRLVVQRTFLPVRFFVRRRRRVLAVIQFLTIGRPLWWVVLTFKVFTFRRLALPFLVKCLKLTLALPVTLKRVSVLFFNTRWKRLMVPRVVRAVWPVFTRLSKFSR